jgi:hypothetical protein
MAEVDVDEFDLFMAAEFHPSGPVLALLPSHLFLFALGLHVAVRVLCELPS